MADPCPICRKDRAVVGRMHLCVPIADSASRNTRHEIPVSRNTFANFVTADTPQTKRGRRPIGDQAMTPGERQRRARHRKAARALKQAERGAAS
jgi:hypothetical protein